MSFLFIPFKCWTKRVRNQGWWNPNSMVHRFRRNSPILSRFERCTLTLGSWQSDCHYSYIPWNVTWRLKKGSWKTNLFGMTSFQEPCSFVGNVNQHHLHLVLWNAHTHTHTQDPWLCCSWAHRWNHHKAHIPTHHSQLPYDSKYSGAPNSWFKDSEISFIPTQRHDTPSCGS